jgi:hypothetical protein
MSIFRLVYLGLYYSPTYKPKYAFLSKTKACFVMLPCACPLPPLHLIYMEVEPGPNHMRFLKKSAIGNVLENTLGAWGIFWEADGNTLGTGI